MNTSLLAAKFYTLRPTSNPVAQPRLTQRPDEGDNNLARLLIAIEE